eukprot:TRINITY_DN28251_c0_g1_i1.p1 TRINITY_DN28251_c0_g1~~TRINITY_DN28251_c0_g1_i1.p1  ORF type:complete len:104 (-),score=4.88 TRINITY_DN28251_c0_g1_i1:63-374(-)
MAFGFTYSFHQPWGNIVALIGAIFAVIMLCLSCWHARLHLTRQRVLLSVAAVTFLSLPVGLFYLGKMHMTWVTIPIGLAFVVRGVLGPSVHYALQHCCASTQP